MQHALWLPPWQGSGVAASAGWADCRSWLADCWLLVWPQALLQPLMGTLGVEQVAQAQAAFMQAAVLANAAEESRQGVGD